MKEHVFAVCAAALALAPESFPPDLPPSEFSIRIGSDAPERYPFEGAVWAMGEDLRHYLLQHPKLKRDPDVQRAITEVVRCRNLRRGRESFVMLLGYTAAQAWAPLMVECLADDDISGHALDTLVKMRVPGYATQVEHLLTSQYTWVRNLARKYVERYPAPEHPL